MFLLTRMLNKVFKGGEGRYYINLFFNSFFNNLRITLRVFTYLYLYTM